MNRDNFMLILLISSAVLTVHQWVMEGEREGGRESRMREGLKFLPKREGERESLRKREKERDRTWRKP